MSHASRALVEPPAGCGASRLVASLLCLKLQVGAAAAEPHEHRLHTWLLCLTRQGSCLGGWCAMSLAGSPSAPIPLHPARYGTPPAVVCLGLLMVEGHGTGVRNIVVLCLIVVGPWTGAVPLPPACFLGQPVSQPVTAHSCRVSVACPCILHRAKPAIYYTQAIRSPGPHNRRAHDMAPPHLGDTAKCWQLYVAIQAWCMRFDQFTDSRVCMVT